MLFVAPQLGYGIPCQTVLAEVLGLTNSVAESQLRKARQALANLNATAQIHPRIPSGTKSNPKVTSLLEMMCPDGLDRRFLANGLGWYLLSLLTS